MFKPHTLVAGLIHTLVVIGAALFTNRTSVAQAVQLSEQHADTGALRSRQVSTEFGEAVDGLRMQLQLAERQDAEKTRLDCAITIENVGSKDLNINLGISLGNGRSHHPVALRLLRLLKERQLDLNMHTPERPAVSTHS